MKQKIKSVLFVLAFPIYSLFSSRVGFCVFWRRKGQWWAYTRGQRFPVRCPRLEELEYFRHFVPKKGSLVFDVGGELGKETEQFARMVGSEGRVLVFECLPDHVRRLNRISEAKRNITVFERACWNQKTTLRFFTGHTPGSNTAVPEARGQVGQPLADPSKAKLDVLADTLDNLWRDLADGRPVDFLKMDIEGAEYEALEGAKEMLKHTRRAVIAAYHLREGVRTADRVALMLKEAGFSVRIDENHHVYATRSPKPGGPLQIGLTVLP